MSTQPPYISTLAKHVFFSSLLSFSLQAADAFHPLHEPLHGGYYDHVGDANSVDIVIHDILTLDKDMPNKPALDIGCGLGGTVKYFVDREFTMQGIDSCPAAIAYANHKYNPASQACDIDQWDWEKPPLKFETMDLTILASFFDQEEFSLLTLFNVAYTIEHKADFLRQAHIITAPGGILAILDYTHANPTTTHSLCDAAGAPLQLDRFKAELSATGWKLIASHDYTDYFIAYYETLLSKIEQQKEALEESSSADSLAAVHTGYTTLLNELKAGTLGGVVMYAQKLAKEKSYS